MANTDRIINHQDGVNIVTQLTTIANNYNVKADIAPIETSPSTAAYSVGDLLYYNNVLYKVIDDIDIGDAIVVNTNVEATVIADNLSGGGHIIEDGTGTDMAAEPALQFDNDFNVTDDSVNGRTVVSIIKTLGLSIDSITGKIQQTITTA